MAELLTAEQVAERLKTSAETVKRMLRQKKLPGYKVSGQWRIDSNDLAAYLAAQKNIK